MRSDPILAEEVAVVIAVVIAVVTADFLKREVGKTRVLSRTFLTRGMLHRIYIPLPRARRGIRPGSHEGGREILGGMGSSSS